MAGVACGGAWPAAGGRGLIRWAWRVTGRAGVVVGVACARLRSRLDSGRWRRRAGGKMEDYQAAEEVAAGPATGRAPWARVGPGCLPGCPAADWASG